MVVSLQNFSDVSFWHFPNNELVSWTELLCNWQSVSQSCASWQWDHLGLM